MSNTNYVERFFDEESTKDTHRVFMRRVVHTYVDVTADDEDDAKKMVKALIEDDNSAFFDSLTETDDGSFEVTGARAI